MVKQKIGWYSIRQSDSEDINLVLLWATLLTAVTRRLKLIDHLLGKRFTMLLYIIHLLVVLPVSQFGFNGQPLVKSFQP